MFKNSLIKLKLSGLVISTKNKAHWHSNKKLSIKALFFTKSSSSLLADIFKFNVLFCSLICIDNSDWTRNGDYVPNRFQAQISAANIIIENRCETNPENTMGIMATAGKRVEMIATLTND